MDSLPAGKSLRMQPGNAVLLVLCDTVVQPKKGTITRYMRLNLDSLRAEI